MNDKGKWIILQFVHQKDIEEGIYELDEVATCHPFNNNLMVFDSIEEAELYQDDHGIDGLKVELPVYEPRNRTTELPAPNPEPQTPNL